MKSLIFNVKRNLKKSPKVYVLSSDKKSTYGSFSASSPDEFENWDTLSSLQRIELKQYMNNMKAITNHLEASGLNEQTDFRFRLPSSFIQCINEINALAFNNDIELDIFEPIVASMIQQLKIVTAKLPEHDKKFALASLEKIGLAEYKKTDYSRQIQSVFNELLNINNKAEKLQNIAKKLFDKDKGISPKSIDDIAKGRLSTSRWLVSCAIEILLQEKLDLLRTVLTEDDLFMLWGKPLLDHGCDCEIMINKANAIRIPGLVERIKTHCNL